MYVAWLSFYTPFPTSQQICHQPLAPVRQKLRLRQGVSRSAQRQGETQRQGEETPRQRMETQRQKVEPQRQGEETWRQELETRRQREET